MRLPNNLTFLVVIFFCLSGFLTSKNPLQASDHLTFPFAVIDGPLSKNSVKDQHSNWHLQSDHNTDTIRPGLEKQRLRGQYIEASKVANRIITYSDTQDKYPSKTYYFHDDSGNVLKTIRQDQFEVQNPIFQLNLPKVENPNAVEYYQPFNENKAIASDSTENHNLIILSSLDQYGLQKEDLSKITHIMGSPLSSIEFIPPLHHQYLIRTEIASLIEFPDLSGLSEQKNTNNILDFTTISIYNSSGQLSNVIHLLEKQMEVAWISGDGKYLFGKYSQLEWDNGELYGDPTKGLIMIDIESEEISELSIPIEMEYIGNIHGFFADRYFQMQLNKNQFIYINPYDRTFYLVSLNSKELDSKNLKRQYFTSFTPFEGISIDLNLYKPVHY